MKKSTLRRLLPTSPVASSSAKRVLEWRMWPTTSFPSDNSPLPSFLQITQ
jgi:hypothetical protein